MRDTVYRASFLMGDEMGYEDINLDIATFDSLNVIDAIKL